MNDEELFEALTAIHNRVHDGFTYVSDETNYGVREDWRYPDDVDNFQDDCDGFAIACRMLIKEQYPELETRLVACTVENGGWHAVCAVGNYILENRWNSIVTVSQLEDYGYVFRYVSGLNPGEPWRRLA